MKTLIALTLFAGMLLGLSQGPARSASFRPSSVAPASAVSASRAETTAANPTAEAKKATEILDGLKSKYRGLEGVTVRMGSTPNHEQAVAYYTQSEIVISPEHSATLEEILAHEVWHVIDWRDNGRLDWGENLPPADPARYQVNPT